MLSRATSIPAATSSARRSGVEEAGPSVHTILALRTQLTLAKLGGRRETNQALVLPATDYLQGMLKIRRVRRLELHVLTRRRVHKAEADRMQPLPPQTELGSEDRVSPIHRIADARMTNRRHMNPDLMRPPGFQLDFEQGRRNEGFQRVVVSDAVPPPTHHRHLVLPPRLPPDCRLDGAGERIRMALHQRVVDLVLASRAERSFQDRVRSLALRDHHQPGGAYVQSLHDAAPLGDTGSRDPETGAGEMAENIRSAPAQTRMSRDADWLVDHHDVVVVVHDEDTFHLLRAYFSKPRMIGELHFEHRPDADTIGFVDRGTIQQHASRPDQLRDPAARKSEHARHGSINPLTVQSIGNQQHLSLSHERSCSDHDHRRRLDLAARTGRGAHQ